MFDKRALTNGRRTRKVSPGSYMLDEETPLFWPVALGSTALVLYLGWDTICSCAEAVLPGSLLAQPLAVASLLVGIALAFFVALANSYGGVLRALVSPVVAVVAIALCFLVAQTVADLLANVASQGPEIMVVVIVVALVALLLWRLVFPRR